MCIKSLELLMWYKGKIFIYLISHLIGILSCIQEYFTCNKRQRPALLSEESRQFLLGGGVGVGVGHPQNADNEEAGMSWT